MDHNFIEIGLAFVEGVALIVSPCIWPVLPLVLSASISGGKKRPFGVIIGFIFSFAIFAWSSRWLISALAIDLDYVKYGSLVFLTLFGIVLISSTLSEKFSALTQGLAGIGARVSVPEHGGFFSGIGVGALIGLIWTPCVGPIIAAVLVQIIRQPSDVFSLYVLLAFALGVGLPMWLIAVTGRTALDRLGFLRTHSQTIRKIFGILILLSVAYIASGVDIPTLLQQRFSTEKVSDSQLEGTMKTENNSSIEAIAAEPANYEDMLIKPVPHPYTAPALIAGSEWLNSPPLTLSELKGKVVLIDFWTYSCINCLRTLPYITSWDAKYRDKGLVIIGVHSPEFAFEKKVDNVKDALSLYKIRYPVMQDNNLETWSNYDNHYWPAHYLIDKNGKVVYTHFGEGEYDATEHNIRVLLGAKEDMPAPQETSAKITYDFTQTPETYLGLTRAENMANENEVIANEAASYRYPDSLKPNEWALQGSWRVEGEKIVSAAKDASLRLRFKAKKVFLVLGTDTEQPATLRLTLNGKPINNNSGKDATSSEVSINEHRLYELINQDSSKEGLLEIQAMASGIEAYAFTFGQ